ncbi:MAG TPA: O-acetyl-ADP-ribose deacetylase [Gaiellales bacterium]|nr:O-acetyl-ADP-ribose deacetylase [Gaiellales bacterium]
MSVEVEVVQGDITRIAVDAIVNAANEGLRGGGGVDGAIHRAGGPAIMAECRALGGCATGDAKATTAGDLPARHVIHAVGPVWHGGDRGEDDLLASAYRRSVEVAVQLDCSSISFPAISTGIYGFPIERAAPIALSTALAAAGAAGGDRLLVFVLFSAGDLEVYRAAL